MKTLNQITRQKTAPVLCAIALSSFALRPCNEIPAVLHVPHLEQDQGRLLIAGAVEAGSPADQILLDWREADMLSDYGAGFDEMAVLDAINDAICQVRVPTIVTETEIVDGGEGKPLSSIFDDIDLEDLDIYTYDI